ncbi:hypothetical protein EQV77_04360 [Halobacillus fulvus]|nr:hypothetical protein EQV77_04360 [Halobacillus fulvus]
MYKVIAMCSVLLFIVGCQSASNADPFEYSEISEDTLEGPVRDFFQQHEDEPGTYLYRDNAEEGENVYLYLNASGETGSYTNFDILDQDERLILVFGKEEGASEPAERYFQIDLKKGYESILGMENGQILPFDELYEAGSE